MHRALGKEPRRRALAKVDRGGRGYGEQHEEVPDVSAQEHEDRGDHADDDGRDPCDSGERHAAILPTQVAEPALTPALALDYLDELSVDIRGALVLDGAGEVAAAWRGDAERGERMREALAALLQRADAAADGSEPVGQLEVGTARGTVFCVRDDAWTLAVVAGRFALSSLMFYDLRNVISDLQATA